MGQSKKSPSTKKLESKAKKSKSKAENDAVALAVVPGTLDPVAREAVSLEVIPLCRNDIIVRLTEKLSHFDAKIILDAAMLSAGLEIKHEGQLNKEEARQICLALIKRGGPAYAVGAGLYREMLG